MLTSSTAQHRRQSIQSSDHQICWPITPFGGYSQGTSTAHSICYSLRHHLSAFRSCWACQCCKNRCRRTPIPSFPHATVLQFHIWDAFGLVAIPEGEAAGIVLWLGQILGWNCFPSYWVVYYHLGSVRPGSQRFRVIVSSPAAVPQPPAYKLAQRQRPRRPLT